MNEIERRIEYLEKWNCRWRNGAAVLFCILFVVITVAARLPEDVADVMRAKRIEVLGPTGEPAIVLEGGAQGASLTLTARGDDGQRAVALSASHDGASLMLMQNKESPLFSVLTDDTGSVMALFDGRDVSRDARCILLRTVRPSDRYQEGAFVVLGRGGAHTRSDIDAMLTVRDPDNRVAVMLGDFIADGVTLQANDGKIELLDGSDHTKPAE